jgi:hypothetical protein
LLPRKNYAADFLWQQMNFGQQHAAARQIKRTSVDFEFLAAEIQVGVKTGL